MNHKCAMQKKDGSWIYTYNGVPYGYCREFNEWSDERINQIFGGDKDAYEHFVAPYRANKDQFHNDGHATKEEALECYKKYTLDFDLRFREDKENANTLNRCQYPDCKEYTSGYANVGAYNMIILCKNHRNRECVSELYEVGESWES